MALDSFKGSSMDVGKNFEGTREGPFVEKSNPISNNMYKFAVDMLVEEWKELGNIESELERVCKKIFGATMFNFCCLMNDAYKDNEKPHVHFQFIPRYKNEIRIFNKVYKDKHFGYNFWKWALNKFKRQKDIYTKEERKLIFNMMKVEFGIFTKV